MNHPLHVVGIGLDGIPGLNPSAQHAIAEATVIAGSEAQLSLLQKQLKDHPAQWLPLTGSVAAWIDQLTALLAHSSVVMLASGDPLFFGIGRLVLDAFPREQLIFYPHISSIQLAFSRIGIPWQEAAIISLHGRDSTALDQAIKQGKSPIALLTDPLHNPAAIADQIVALKPTQSYQIWICSRLGSLEEQVISLDLDQVKSQTFSEPLVMILVARPDPDPLPQTLPTLGIPDAWFHTYSDQPGLITKVEIRVQILGLLQLPNSGVIWDVGSGTGSIAIEIARLVPQSTIYAIEKRAAGIQLIAKNRQRFQTPNLEIISGSAPDALDPLPDPCRVMIGGGGQDLAQILALVQNRLCPGGIVVASFATLESAGQGIQSLQDWSPQLLQVNVARSVRIAGSTRWSPLNPVMLLWAQKPQI